MTPEFEKDSELITKFVVIAAGLSKETEMVKQAGIVDSLKSIGQGIVEDVKNRYKEEGILGATATYAGTAMLPFPLKIIAYLSEWIFDFSLGDLVNKAIEAAKDLVDSGGELTVENASAIADKVTQGITTSASLNELYKIEKEGEIVSILSGPGFEKEAGFTKEAGAISKVLMKIFKKLGFRSGKTKAIAGGLIKWFVKAVLFGLAAAKTAVLMEGPGEVTEEVSGEGAASPSFRLPSATSHSLKSSGKGNQYFINQGNRVWIVRLANGSSPYERIKSTLIQWCIAVYPELQDKSSELANSGSIHKMALTLASQYNDMYPQYLQMPEGVHTWKDVVDRSIGDVV